MARDYAKTNLSIWDDPEWRSLPWPAQHVYKMFWEHPKLSYCGVTDWRPAKMLGWGDGWARADFDALTDCLQARHFLVVDEVTEECLVRSWVRFDGVIKQPRLAVSLCNSFSEVGSNDIRGVIVNELVKLHEREPDAAGWAKPRVLDLLALPQVEAKSLPTPRDPFASGFAIRLGSVSDAFGPNGSSGLGSVSVPPTTAPASTPATTQHPGSADAVSDSADAEPTRRDVESLCTRLADHIEANGAKRPNVTKAWRDAARLLMDRDGRTEQQVAWMIDWCQRDEFWHTNILSMPKLREKFDQLVLKAKPGNTGLRLAANGNPIIGLAVDDKR